MSERIRIRANTISNGFVVEVPELGASYYSGPLRFRFWRARRLLATWDKWRGEAKGASNE